MKNGLLSFRIPMTAPAPLAVLLGSFDWPQGLTWIEGLALTAGAALFVVVAWRLPSRWPSLRAPTVFGGLYLLTLALRAVRSSETGLVGALLPVSVFLLTVCVGRLALLAAAERGRLRSRGPLPAGLVRLLLIPIYALAALLSLAAADLLTADFLLGLALLTGAVLWAGADLLRHATAGVVLRAEGGLAPGEGLGLADGTVGRILKVGWRTTVVLAPDGTEVSVPNRRLLEEPFRLTRGKKSVWRSVAVACSAEIPPGAVEAVVLAALRDCPEVEQEPAPSVLVRDVSGRGVEYGARFLPRDEEAGERADSEVRVRLWYAPARAGVPLASAGPPPAADAGAAGRVGRLRRVDLFAGLPDDVLAALAAASRALRYGRGETIFRQGDPGDDLYIIDSGAVVLIVRDAEGAEREITRMEAGQCFGEMALLTGEHRSATVRAARETELIVLTKGGFGSVLQTAPALAQALRQVLESRQAERSRFNQRLAGEHGESLVDRFARRFDLAW